ncbi:MAG: hypothetical protein LLG09_08310 [Negativicutes bacterium]|nr:hypothetical protein [Negativicutes bacterium]
MAGLAQNTVQPLPYALAKGEARSVALAKDCLRTIAKHNHSGKRINAVLKLNPEALFEAQAADRERATQHRRRPQREPE